MPELKRIGKCSACERPIIWATTSTGKAMPVDAVPVDHGNVLLFPSVDEGRFVALVLGRLELVHQNGRERYTSHFATCPYAELFRPKKLHKSTGKR
jgi:hypothetical protein